MDHLWRWVRRKRFPVVSYGPRAPGVVEQVVRGGWGVARVVGAGMVAVWVMVVVVAGLVVWQVAAWSAKVPRVHVVDTERQAGVVSQ